jgi:hypothetical protein
MKGSLIPFNFLLVQFFKIRYIIEYLFYVQFFKIRYIIEYLFYFLHAEIMRVVFRARENHFTMRGSYAKKTKDALSEAHRKHPHQC